jgi:signal transduction histidine kinase
MRKRTIFFKIYLWFWLATALILTIQISLDRLTDSGPMAFHLEQNLKPVLSLYGQRALNYYLSGDTEGLRKWSEELERSTALSAHLINPGGKDVTGGPLSKEVRAVVERTRLSGKSEISLTKYRALMALPLSAPNSNFYYVVGDMSGRAFIPPPPPRSILFDVFRLLIALVVSAGVCYALARYLTIPIIKLRGVTQRLAGGDLAVRIGKILSKRKDEFSGLAEDFDHMAQRIESLMNRQRQLLGDISHELRSPLTRLNLALELARRKTANAETTAALDRIETEAGLLEEMIAKLLTLTRLESGAEKVKMGPVDLTKLVADIAADADFEARAHNCNTRIVESVPCNISGNVELLQRAIENVVRNAVRYTQDGTTVEITLQKTAETSDAYARITVRDYGPGVSEDELTLLFHPFYRVSNARERQTGGTGLGLAITQRAVNLHHGSVVASSAEDGGLIVTIQVPLLP